MGQMDTIREQAAEWLIHFDAGTTSTPAQDPEFLDWLARDPRHRQVFEQMQRLWSGASPAVSPSHLGRVLGAVGFCLAVAVIGLQLPWQVWRADYRSGVGEVATIALPDGSELTLNTNSAVNVDFEQGQRRIELIRGEVLLDVESDPEHPFIVATGDASAEALGTLYSVHRHDDHSRVTVFESRVRVTSPGTTESLELSAGQWARVDATSIRTGAGSLPATPDWSRHQLIFNGASLKHVVERLDDYHSGVLMLSDTLTNGNRRFTGALHTDDSEAALSLLAASLKLEIGGLPPYVVYLDEAP